METTTGAPTILLVENNEHDEQAAMAALTELGLPANVVVLHDGATVFDYFFATQRSAGGRRGHMPDLILMELALPRLDGLKVLQLLHSTHRDELWKLPPIVVFTRQESPDAVTAAYRLGARGFVHKPASRRRLMEVVQEIVLYWLQVNVAVPKGPPRHGGSESTARGSPLLASA